MRHPRDRTGYAYVWICNLALEDSPFPPVIMGNLSSAHDAYMEDFVKQLGCDFCVPDRRLYRSRHAEG